MKSFTKIIQILFFLILMLSILYFCVGYSHYIDEWQKGGFTLRKIPDGELSGELIFSSESGKVLQFRYLDKNYHKRENENSKIVDFILTNDLKLYRCKVGEYDSSLKGNLDFVVFGRDKKYIGRLRTIDVNITNSSISPDGKKLAFILKKDMEGNTGFLYVISIIDSTALVTIENVPRYYNISWAPDSSKFLFNRTQNELYIYNFKNKSFEKFGDGADGVWSPDGKEIACRSSKGNHLLIYRNSGERICSFKVYYPFSICWSPDGNFVAYFRSLSFLGTSYTFLEISNRSGTAKKVILEDSPGTGFLAWVN